MWIFLAKIPIDFVSFFYIFEMNYSNQIKNATETAQYCLLFTFQHDYLQPYFIVLGYSIMRFFLADNLTICDVVNDHDLVIYFFKRDLKKNYAMISLKNYIY